ncbi:hypothetical protein VNO78_03574 [Psophocarpus tetragonolobus]|uniref:Uncharacterized protein n=1 Tax=Psophocarpus tetragonolobus TaxID=3891 RepID=A0AAN9XW21_PSOTE
MSTRHNIGACSLELFSLSVLISTGNENRSVATLHKAVMEIHPKPRTKQKSTFGKQRQLVPITCKKAGSRVLSRYGNWQQVPIQITPPPNPFSQRLFTFFSFGHHYLHCTPLATIENTTLSFKELMKIMETP